MLNIRSLQNYSRAACQFPDRHRDAMKAAGWSRHDAAAQVTAISARPPITALLTYKHRFADL
jgi:hypothetical protein